MRKILITTIMVLCSILMMTAQQENNFLKGSNQVNQNTGKAVYNLPIHTINELGISVPIYLQNNMGGIKVDDLGTDVGTGWSKSAGATITRVQQGAWHDERNMNHALWIKTILGIPYVFNHNTVGYIDHFTNSNYSTDYFKYGSIDTEPDIFYYNVEGISGSFIFKHNSEGEVEVVFLESTNIKVEFNIKTDEGSLDSDRDDQNHIIGWKLITPSGNAYYLGAFESDEFDSANTEYTTSVKNLFFQPESNQLSPETRPFQFKYSSKWFVSKIENQDNKIEFTYDDEYLSLKNTLNKQFIYNNPNDVENEFYNSPESFNIIKSKRIIKIESKYTVIEFNYDLIRKNVTVQEFLPKLLNKIQIFSKTGSTLNCVSNLGLSYIYSENSIPYYHEKYFLNSLSKTDCDNTNNYNISFDYFDIDQAQQTPIYGQDSWGFNNGITTNNDLFYIPEISIDCQSFQKGININNRSLNFEAARSGTLKSVTYPNGTKEKFEFEFNTVFTVGLDKSKTEMESFSVNSSSLENCPSSNHIIQDFNLNDISEYALIISKNNTCDNSQWNVKPIKVYKEIDNNLIFLSDVSTSLLSREEIIQKLNLELNVSYKLHFLIDSNEPFGYGSYDVEFIKTPLVYKNWPVSGMRIKSVAVNDIKTQYVYDFEENLDSLDQNETYTLEICGNCASSTEESCPKNEDSTPFIYFGCNSEISFDLFPESTKDCPSQETGAVTIRFMDKNNFSIFSMLIYIPENFNGLTLTDDQLTAAGLTKGLFYKVELEKSVGFPFTKLQGNLMLSKKQLPIEGLVSSGIQLISPLNVGLYALSFDEMINGECASGDYYFLNTNANNFFQSGGNAQVIYKKVKQFVDISLNGYTTYHFNVNESVVRNHLISNYFNPSIPIVSVRRPRSHMFLPKDFSLLTKMVVHNSENQKIIEENYFYKIENEKYTFPFLKYFYTCSNPSEINWKSTNYNLYKFDAKIESVEHWQDDVVTIKEYTYHPDIHIAYKSIKSYNKAFPDEYNIQEITYSTELSEYDFLTDRNYILPIESLNNDGLGGGSKMKYGLVNDKVRLLENYAYDSDGTDASSKWIKTSENIAFSDEGFVTESWSKKDPLNSFFFFDDGLLTKTSYGSRETRFFYDDLRRKRLTIDPTGIGTYIHTLDDFHRVIKTQTGIVSDFSNIENVQFSHIKAEQNNSYVIEKETDEEIRTDISFPSDNYGLGTHSSTAYIDEYGRNYKNILHEFTQTQQDYESKTLYNSLSIPINQCSPGSGGCSFSVFEKSPRSRLEKTRAPGASKFVEYKYGNEVPNIDGLSEYYIKTSVQDENGNITRSYSNVTGRKKIIIDALNQRTTYLYNDRGQLISVSTAGGTEYVYHYDGFGRLESKTIPLKGNYVYAYDQYENLDSEILPNGKILHYNYHSNYNDFLLSVQDDNGVDLQRYTPYHADLHTSWVEEETIKVLDENKTLTSTFTYDDYGRVSNRDQTFYDGSFSSYAFQYDDMDNLRLSSREHTPSTGTEDAYEISTRFEYDRGRRLEEVYKTLPNIAEEFLVSRHKYNERDWQVYKNQGGLFSEVYQYNNRGWLKSINSIEQSYPPQIRPCDEAEDDAFCTTKKPPNSGLPVYEPDQPNSDLFSMHLYYSQGNKKLQAPAQHNGNIAWMEWRVKGENIQKYGFQYDPINRLEQARYSAFDRLNCEVKNKGAYNVNIDAYDSMGNIGKIRRNGLIQYNSDGEAEYGLIDDLILDYEDGYLSDITENSLTDKGYKELSNDAGIGIDHEVGNMINSSKQGIDLIDYNFLDLPTHVQMSTGITLDFVYDALGNQLQMTKSHNNTEIITDYFNGIEYVNGALESIYFEEGRAVYNQSLAGTENNPYLEWVINDHLGNVRVRYVDKNNDGVISVNSGDDISNEIIGSYHYYPFGMKMDGAWNEQQGNRNKYQYNGIEHLDDIGLSFATFRIHDPALGRWLQVDPLAEKYKHISPFVAMNNNPISFADPNGDSPILIGAAVGAGVGVLANGITNSINDDPFFQGAGQAALYGAIGGALGGYGATNTTLAILNGAGSALSPYLPSYNISLGNFTIGVSPALLFGNNGIGIGLNVNATYQTDNFYIGASIGISLGISDITQKLDGQALLSGYAGYDNGTIGISFATNYFDSGERTQRTGYLGLRYKDFTATYENDGTPFQWLGLGDGGDSFRSAAASLGWKELTLTMLIHTGRRDYTKNKEFINYPYDMVSNPQINKYLSASLFIGYRGYRAGINHWKVGHIFQNKIAHQAIQPQPWIPWDQNKFGKGYFQYNSGNQYSHW